MRVVRRRLSIFVGLSLVTQLAGLVTAPRAFAASIATEQCTCPPGTAPGDACPMHHHERENKRDCVLRSASSTGDSALLSLMGGLGIIRPLETFAGGTVVARSVVPATQIVLSRSDRPESPPPRA